MRKIISTKVFYCLMWLLFGANIAVTFYWVVTDSGVYRPVSQAMDSVTAGVLVSMLVLLCAQALVTWPLRAISNVASVEERLRDIRVPDPRVPRR